jgi:N-acetylmuramoyl-L-alanine amidase
MLICVDAGHGGRDPGAIGPTGLHEADVTLKMAGWLTEALTKRGHRVVLTRTGREGVSLRERARIANAAGVDVFVSLHCNSFKRQSAHGSETYHYPGPGPGSRLAYRLQKELVRTGGRSDRGVKAARFAVLRRTLMPAALVELAFISNRAEEGLLSDEGWLVAVADGLAAGIHSWQPPKAA